MGFNIKGVRESMRTPLPSRRVFTTRDPCRLLIAAVGCKTTQELRVSRGRRRRIPHLDKDDLDRTKWRDETRGDDTGKDKKTAYFGGDPCRGLGIASILTRIPDKTWDGGELEGGWLTKTGRRAMSLCVLPLV